MSEWSWLLSLGEGSWLLERWIWLTLTTIRDFFLGFSNAGTKIAPTIIEALRKLPVYYLLHHTIFLHNQLHVLFHSFETSLSFRVILFQAFLCYHSFSRVSRNLLLFNLLWRLLRLPLLWIKIGTIFTIRAPLFRHIPASLQCRFLEELHL